MKSCDYCGHNNDESTEHCSECGSRLKGSDGADRSAGLQARTAVSFRAKSSLVLAAWGVVLAASAAANPANLLTAPLFPLGLLAFLRGGEKNAVIAWMIGTPAILVGWLIYALLWRAMLSSKRAWAFGSLYVLFCFLLALNLAGCKRTLDAFRNLH
jgi:hypothetical protein